MKKEQIYLVAYYSMRPQRRSQTQIKGWMNNPDSVQYDEQVAITRRLKNNDLTMAKIILDMTNKKVVRNGWGTTTDFDEMFKYFSNGYPQYTYQVMSRLDPEYMTQFQKQVGTAEEAQTLLAAKGMLETEVIDTSDQSTINT